MKFGISAVLIIAIVKVPINDVIDFVRQNALKEELIAKVKQILI